MISRDNRRHLLPLSLVASLAVTCSSAFAKPRTSARFFCNTVGAAPPKPLGDKDGHAVSVRQFLWHAASQLTRMVEGIAAPLVLGISMTLRNADGRSLCGLAALPALVILLQAGSVMAQQNDPDNPRKQHLKACVQNLTIKVSQAEALKGVMQQPLEPRQQLKAVRDLLTPEQRQELRICLHKPMSPQSAP